VVEATADVGNYYLRAAVQNCGQNLNNGISGTAHGIVHYQGAGNNLPNSTATTFVNGCVDEPLSSLVPVVSKTVDSAPFAAKVSALLVEGPSRIPVPVEGTVFRWYLNHVTQNIDWSNPTILQVARGENNFTAAEDIIQLPDANVWTYWIIQNEGGVAHP
jgi:L-ascorbate oxidase